MLKVYGIEHIIYLLATTIPLALIMVLLKFKIKSDKSQRIMFMILGIIDILSVTLNRIAYTLDENSWFYIIPDSFCGMSGLVLGIGLTFFKKDNLVLHAVWLIALVGMIATYAYPDFLESSNSIFKFTTITSFWHHTVTLFNLIAIFLFKYMSITYKKAWVQIPGTIVYISIGLFLLFVGHVDGAFYLNQPAIKGTVLYFNAMFPMYLAVYGIILFLVEFSRRKHKKEELVLKEA